VLGVVGERPVGIGQAEGHWPVDVHVNAQRV
jgi:hypothetical protein